VLTAPTLRPYQHGAIAGVHRELATHRSTLVVSATGTGKTVTFAELARLEVQRGGRVLILVHRDELIRQARRKCEAVGLWPDVEKGKQRANTLAKVVLASVQSLRGKRLARWARSHFTLVIVDEAHHATANRAIARSSSTSTARRSSASRQHPIAPTGSGSARSSRASRIRYEIRQAITDEYLVPIVARRIVVDSVDLSTVRCALATSRRTSSPR
jgi:superfamily II DNA or RNA helicase